MNKGNLNKLVTNYPVELTEEEISNLSGTLAPVIAACGGGGGGAGGKIYTGIGFVSVNNTTNQIGLTNEANTKLNQDIPTKVSDLSDSANYQTVAGMDQYLTELEAQSTYLTKSSADNDYAPLSTTADVNALKAASGDFSQYYKKNETYNKTEVYSKTETSSKETLSAEFNKYQTIAGMYDYVTNQVLADTITNLDNSIALKQNKLTFGYDENNAISSIDGSALAGNGGKTYSAGAGIAIVDEYISLSADYIQAITQVSGKQNELEFTYDNSGSIIKINNSAIAGGAGGSVSYTGRNGVEINGNYIELETTAKTAIDSVGGISTDVGTLKTASANWNKVSDKLDTTAFSTVSANFLTAHQSLEDYATKSDINGMATQTWVGEQGFYTKASGDNDYAPKSVTSTINTLTGASAGWNEVTAKLDKSIYSNASGNWENTYNVVKQYSAAGTWLTAHQPLTNYYTKSETSGAGELSTEFAKYVTSSNVTTPDSDYVMTTTGWKVLTLPGGGMTQVIHDETLTGQGNANDSKLGVAWSALSGNTIDSALSAGSATSAYKAASASAAKRLQNSTGGPVIQVEDVTALQNWASSNSSTWDEVSAKLGTAQYANDSATFVTKPDTTQTVLNNNYLIYSTLTDPTATTGWMPLSANYYSKTEADGRYQKKEDMNSYLTTAQYETDSATFVTSSSNTITGTKQYALTTTGWSDIGLSAYLPTSGGTVSGQLEVHGGSNFDTQFIKLTREGNSCGARIGLGSDTTNGTLALKTFNSQGQNTVQVNIKHNTNNNELIQVQKGGTDVGFLIPAVTATTTAGITDDGILHIIIES